MATVLGSNNWYRLEGYVLAKEEYRYSKPIPNLASYDIWYTKVEVQFQNPTIANFVHGVNYKVRTFKSYGCNTITDINDEIDVVLPEIIDENKDNDSSATYSQAFTISESSVILYGDAHSDTLDKQLIILIDESYNDNLIGISAVYEGPPIPMDEEFSEEDVNITGVFSDGHKSRVQSGFFITRAEDGQQTKMINKVGGNLFVATITTGDQGNSNTFTANFVVTGVKKLDHITATYEGPSIAIGKTPKKKHIIVTAVYTDGSASTVTDWTFSQGNKITENNNGVLEITYKGKYCDVTINNYATFASQLKAFYNGNRVEVGAHYQTSNVQVKICYTDSTGLRTTWEVLQDEEYTIDSTLVAIEGSNVFTVTYVTNNNDVLTTNFVVTGFRSQKAIDHLEAIYTGPPIRVGKTFNEIKVICRAYYNDGSISEINNHNFNLSTTLIENVGDNPITLIFEEIETIFNVPGIEAQDTTGSSYSPTKLDLQYPEMSKVNFRRRGPIESEKLDNYNKDIYENITRLSAIYSELYERFNYMVHNVSNLANVGINTLNVCNNIQDRLCNINKNK